MVFIDGTIVNLALQRIGHELPTTRLGVLEGQTYVVAGYMATLAALLLLGGALGDRFGRRRVFIIGLTGFGAASAGCGLAPTMEALVAARILQGIAGAMLVPGSIAVITATFPPDSRGRAFGLWASATAAVNLLGPAVGGFIVTAVSWRVAFLVNLPIAAIALWLTVRWMAESRDENAGGRFDVLGAIVAVIAVGGLMFGAVSGQQREWREPFAFEVLAIGGVASVAFLALMRRPGALVPLELFRNRRFAAINASTLTIYAGLYSMFFFQALFLQSILGYSPLGAALVGTVTALTLTLLSARVGAWSGRIGVRPFLTVGPLVGACGALWWLTVPVSSPGWRPEEGGAQVLPPLATLYGPGLAMLLLAVGMALVVAPLTTALMSSVPVGQAGVASALNNAISRVGQPLVLPLVFLVVSATFYAALAPVVPGATDPSSSIRTVLQPMNPPPATLAPVVAEAARRASTDAFHLVVTVVAALYVAGSIINFVGLREPVLAAVPARDRG